MSTVRVFRLRLVPGLILLALFLLPRPAGAQDASAGLLDWTVGKVSVVRQGVTVQPSVRYHLAVGDRIHLAKGASAEVMFFLGRTVIYQLLPGPEALVEQKRISVGGKEAKIVTRVATTPLGPARHVGILGGFMRGLSNGLDTPDPFGSFAGPGVTLTWQNHIPASDRVPLMVTLRRDGEGDPFYSAPVAANATQFRIPSGIIDSDTVYFWEVVPATGEALYRTQGVLWQMTPAEISLVHTTQADAAKLRHTLPKSPAADLLLATVYENVGLYRRALAAYRAAQVLSPDHAAYADDIAQLANVLEK